MSRAVTKPENGDQEGKDNYFAVPVQSYAADQEIETTLYLRYDGNFIVFQEAGGKWKQDDSRRLKDFGANELYVKVEKESDWQDFMEDRMPRLLSDAAIPSTQKAKFLYDASASSIDSFFKNVKSPEAARKSVSFVKHCVGYLCSDKDAFHNVFNSSTQTLVEKVHGIHCATYAVTLAKQLGHTNEHELSALGIGAVLHDIGKTRISSAILDKKGPLDEMEWMEIRKHPRYGYDMLQRFESIPELARLIVWQHHERPDGSGYPNGLSTDIHLFSNIVAIADVFDSMTSHRPYKAQSPSFQTMLELLSTQMGRLDKTLLISFIEMMKK